MKPAKELWLEIHDHMFDKDWPRAAVEIIRNAQIEAWQQGVEDTVESLYKHVGFERDHRVGKLLRRGPKTGEYYP